MIEIWKDIPGYEGCYQVSDFGRVRSLDRFDFAGHKLKGRILKQILSRYFFVNLHNGKQITRRVHQLVCEAFIGPCPEGMEVCHGQKGKLDNSLTNLRYGTSSENSQDRFRDGTSGNKPVICSDGREFISGVEAGRVTGCAASGITACCKGKYKTCGGYGWGYATNKT